MGFFDLFKAKKQEKQTIALDSLGSWINENFDHTTILSIEDKKLGDAIEKETKQKIYYLVTNGRA